MRILTYVQVLLLALFSMTLWGQEAPAEREGGHTNSNKFKQLYEEFSTPIVFVRLRVLQVLIIINNRWTM